MPKRIGRCLQNTGRRFKSSQGLLSIILLVAILAFAFAFSIITTYELHVPMVLNNYVPVPTSAPTPSRTATPTQGNIIRNPSFDDGTSEWEVEGCEMMVVTDVFDHSNNVLMIKCPPVGDDT